MEKALELEPQVQIFEMDNIKKIHNAYGPFTYLLAFNQLQVEHSKEQKLSSAHFCTIRYEDGLCKEKILVFQVLSI
jgi:phosphopantetheine adenylyltransferase